MKRFVCIEIVGRTLFWITKSGHHNNNNNNNWNLYSAFSIHKMFKSAAHCHSLSHSQQRLNGRA